jgi:hypothetical protein
MFDFRSIAYLSLKTNYLQKRGRFKDLFNLPSPMPELRRTPHANQIALVKLRDSSFW